MTLVIPPGVPADGTVLVKWVPTIADPTAPKLETEVNAAGALDLSCYIDPSSFGISNNQDTVEDNRLCAKTSYEIPGRSKWTLDNFLYTYDVQNPSSVANKAYAALIPGTSGFLVIRWGKDVDTVPLDAAQIVDVIPVTLGAQVKQKPEANTMLKVSQKFFIIGAMALDKTLAA